ncbi:MAG: 16S rRNA (uracil(1498)-N(3))-methyltransferase [Mollicutes bacterium]|nr:16S rRNA (uracil(1498)-N(3))-methyltransferase [Mollicutes bacterium]
MQHYFALSKNLDLSISDLHHINNVMRMKIGDQIIIIYNKIKNFVELTEIKPVGIKFKIIKSETFTRENPEIVLAVSLVNEQKWDLILQKATELGVNQIIPIVFERTIIKLDDKKLNQKQIRWQKIVKEAAEQSHRFELPIISNLLSYHELKNISGDLKIICSTKEKQTNLKDILKNNLNCDRIIVVIGPEGGLTDLEEEKLITYGFQSITLGNNILRVETVPMFILSIFNYEMMR